MMRTTSAARSSDTFFIRFPFTTPPATPTRLLTRGAPVALVAVDRPQLAVFPRFQFASRLPIGMFFFVLMYDQ